MCCCLLLSSHCFCLTLFSSLPSSGMNEPICATMPLPASVQRLCERRVTCSGCWLSLILRENTDAAFCFCPCFTSRLVFISAMVIGFSSFYGPSRSLSEWKGAGRASIDPRGSRDPLPTPPPPPPPGATQPISTVSIFYECFWRKSGRWGTAPNTTPVNKEAGKERSHRWDGRSVLLLRYRLVFVFIICLLKMFLCNPPRTNAWSETRSKRRQL